MIFTIEPGSRDYGQYLLVSTLSAFFIWALNLENAFQTVLRGFRGREKEPLLCEAVNWVVSSLPVKGKEWRSLVLPTSLFLTVAVVCE